MQIFVCISYVLFILFVIPTFINNYIRYVTNIRAPVAVITRNPSYYMAVMYMLLITPFLLFVDELHYVFYMTVYNVLKDSNVSDLTGFVVCIVVYSLLIFITLVMATREYEDCYVEARSFITHIKNHCVTNQYNYHNRHTSSTQWIELEMMHGRDTFYINCPKCISDVTTDNV